MLFKLLNLESTWAFKFEIYDIFKYMTFIHTMKGYISMHYLACGSVSTIVTHSIVTIYIFSYYSQQYGN